MTQETINQADNIDLKRKAQDELVQDAKIVKPVLEAEESCATLTSDLVTEPTEDADAKVSADDEEGAKVEDVTEEEEEEEEVAPEEEEEEEEKPKSKSKSKKAKKDASSDFEEDVEEDDEGALDKSNIIPSGRRTRGKVIDFKALVASDDEDDEDDE